MVFKMNGLTLLHLTGEAQSTKLNHKEQDVKQQVSR